MTPSGPQTERKRGSGVKIVYDVLRDEVLSLILQPGSPIDEVALADRFGMSRTPIREALVRLEGEGLITTLPNRSTMVSNIDYLNLDSFFDAIVLMYRVTGRQAALRHRAEDLPRIKGLQGKFRAAVAAQDALAMIATNREFHVAIAEAGRNSYYTQLCTRLLDDGRRILWLYHKSYHDRLPQQYVDEHDAIIAAIEARDVETADQISKLHADQIVRQVQKLFAGDQSNSIKL